MMNFPTSKNQTQIHGKSYPRNGPFYHFAAHFTVAATFITLQLIQQSMLRSSFQQPLHFFHARLSFKAIHHLIGQTYIPK